MDINYSGHKIYKSSIIEYNSELKEIYPKTETIIEPKDNSVKNLNNILLNDEKEIANDNIYKKERIISNLDIDLLDNNVNKDNENLNNKKNKKNDDNIIENNNNIYSNIFENSSNREKDLIINISRLDELGDEQSNKLDYKKEDKLINIKNEIENEENNNKYEFKNNTKPIEISLVGGINSKITINSTVRDENDNYEFKENKNQINIVNKYYRKKKFIIIIIFFVLLVFILIFYLFKKLLFYICRKN